MLLGSDGARCDTRTAFQILSRDVGQGEIGDAMAGALSSVARHTQKSRFAGTGVTHDGRQAIGPGYVFQRGPLLGSEHQAVTPGSRDRLIEHGCRETMAMTHPASVSAACSSRRSVSIISRLVKRVSPRPSLPSVISSGDARTAAMTRSNWSFPSLWRCTNVARSRVVKVACPRVTASSAMRGSARIFSRRCCARSRGAR